MYEYTTLSRVKQELHIISGSSVDDALLSVLITSASRAWDRKCTGVPDSIGYFFSGSVTNEPLMGQIDNTAAQIICYPHKPIVTSVSSFSFQASVVDSVYTVDPSRIDIIGPKVVAYPSSQPLNFPGQCKVTISYVGGLGSTISTGSATDLPDDMVEAVTILTARFYREAETGLGDAIGIAELSEMVYTKAWPIRVTDLLTVYKRKAGWRYVA